MYIDVYLRVVQLWLFLYNLYWSYEGSVSIYIIVQSILCLRYRFGSLGIPNCQGSIWIKIAYIISDLLVYVVDLVFLYIIECGDTETAALCGWGLR